MDKLLFKKTDQIFYFQINNDGFSLGDQRLPIKENDLPKCSKIVKNYLKNPQNNEYSITKKEISKKKGWRIVQDVAWRNYEYVPKLTMAGYSVMIKEISNQTKHYITHVFLQAGVGGMAAGIISGIANYFKRIPKIIVIEPENANCVMKSIKYGYQKKVNIQKQSIMGGMSCAEVSLVPWRILKNAVNNCVSVSDKYVPQTLTMLAKKNFSNKKIVAGECSTPGVISIISCCNDPLVKRKLEINEKSNILIIGCEGDTDKNLYNKLYKIGNQKLKKYD